VYSNYQLNYYHVYRERFWLVLWTGSVDLIFAVVIRVQPYIVFTIAFDIE
jgi:hypothetical protein